MSELTLSLKNKKQSQGGIKTGNEANYLNLVKPLVTAGRAGPQTTKHTPANIENFQGRPYTQRIGAQNAAINNSANMNNFTG